MTSFISFCSLFLFCYLAMPFGFPFFIGGGGVGVNFVFFLFPNLKIQYKQQNRIDLAYSRIMFALHLFFFQSKKL